jgi:predicted DNA-binding transcriptional regulator AlpA
MKFITREDLKARGIHWSNKHLLQMEKAGRFPQRMYLSEKTVAWIADEIDAFQAAKASGRYATRIMTPGSAA